MSGFLDWFDALPDHYFFAIVVLLWLLASLIVGVLFGRIARWGRGQFDHADMIERAREQRRRELQR